jgi:carboxypeptidase PM20D1
MKKIILALLLCIVVLCTVILFKTFSFNSKQLEVEPIADITIDTKRVAQNLSRAIQYKTISSQDPSKFDAAPFLAFHKFLEEAFPGIHSQLKKEVINKYSLLYRWKGSDENLKPIVLMAHFDVVPVPYGSGGDWTYPPFSGKIADGFIWGRGSLDDKGCLIATMEAVEALLTDGYTPRRTVYLAFGHDEEIGGSNGAAYIAELFQTRNVKAEWVLDEGAIVAMDLVPGVTNPVSLIGIAEKGYVTLVLTVEHAGGHSAMPPPQSAVGILSTAIHNLQDNPFPADMESPGMQMFDYVGPEMPFGMKLLFANRWLFSPLIKSELEKTKSMNAIIRTTIAPTIFNAGTKENVLPQKATAMVNFRLLPGDSVEYAVKHVKESIDDPRIMITISEIHQPLEASPVSDINQESYRILQQSIRQVFPQSIAAPFLVVAGTDTKHYKNISGNIYRFLPVRITSEDLERFHGTNERLGVNNLEEMVKFYIQLIRNSNKA